MTSGRTYKSKYQGQGGIFKASKTASGQQYMGSQEKDRFGNRRYADGLFQNIKKTIKKALD
jgi:hypothetical protein